MPDQGDRTPRNAALLERFEGRLPEIFEDAPVEELRPAKLPRTTPADAHDDVTADEGTAPVPETRS